MPFSHIALAVFVMMLWGFNFTAIGLALHQINPLLLCVLRFFFSSLPAIFFIARPSIPFRKVMEYGLLTFALQFVLLFLGMYLGVTAGLTALLLQSNVFFSMFFAFFFLKEPIHGIQIIAAIIAFLGVAIIWSHIQGQVTPQGFLCVIAAAVCWSLGSLFARKMGKTNMFSVVVWSSFIAWPPVLFVFAGIQGEQTLPLLSQLFSLSWISWSAILFISYVSTLFCFYVWNNLLSHYPLTVVAPFTLLVPVFGMLSSALILKETLDSWKIYAGILIIIGLCVNLMGGKILKKKMIQ